MPITKQEQQLALTSSSRSRATEPMDLTLRLERRARPTNPQALRREGYTTSGRSNRAPSSQRNVTTMAIPCDDQARQRAHAERMLARANRRRRQAMKLVEKWRAKIAALDREGVAAKQARLFADDLPACDVRSQESVL